MQNDSNDTDIKILTKINVSFSEIKNFLNKKISINFIDGFNAFTGETGAGKSIIIEGLKLALGGKIKQH